MAWMGLNTYFFAGLVWARCSCHPRVFFRVSLYISKRLRSTAVNLVFPSFLFLAYNDFVGFIFPVRGWYQLVRRGALYQAMLAHVRV